MSLRDSTHSVVREFDAVRYIFGEPRDYLIKVGEVHDLKDYIIDADRLDIDGGLDFTNSNPPGLNYVFYTPATVCLIDEGKERTLTTVVSS